MKEYGIDLQNKLESIEQQKKSIESKIKKRLNFLIKESKKRDILPETFENIHVDSLKAKAHLFLIKQLEDNYTDQFVQINLFNNG